MLMRQMRQNTKIIMLVTALAFVALMVFEWGMDMSGQTAGGDLGRVGGTSVSVQEYQNVYRSLYDQVQRSQEQPISTQQNREIEDRAWEELVNQILIRMELDRRGIRVTDEEIRQAARFAPPPELRNDPAFQTDGQFDLERYHEFMNQASQDPQFLLQLEAYYRDVIPREKLVRQVTSGIFVSNRELWERWKAENETVQATFLAVDPDVRVHDGDVEVTRDEIEAYYREHRDDFAVPARARVLYTYLDKRPAAADSAAVTERALELRREIVEEGREFAEVAEVESGDEATAGRGGEIGTVTRDDLPPPLQEVAFSLPVGEVSEPVESHEGLHLVEVLSREEDEVELRHILLPMERTDDSEFRLLTRADSLEALGETRPLREAAAEFGVPILEADVTEDFAILPGVGPADEGQSWIFEDREGPGAVSPLFETRDAFYMLEVVRQSPAGYLSLDEVAGEIEETLRTGKKRDRVAEEAREWIGDLRDGRLTLEELGESIGVEVRAPEAFSRADFVPGLGTRSAAAGAAFGTPAGSFAGPVEAQGRIVLLRVDERREADREEWEAQKELQRAMVTAEIRQDRLEKWLDGLRETVRIVDGRADYFRAVEEQDERPGIPMVF